MIPTAGNKIDPWNLLAMNDDNATGSNTSLLLRPALQQSMEIQASHTSTKDRYKTPTTTYLRNPAVKLPLSASVLRDQDQEARGLVVPLQKEVAAFHNPDLLPRAPPPVH